MRRPKRSSIVPTMEVLPPSPQRLATSLVASSTAVGTVLAVLTLLIAPVVLALPGLTFVAGVRLAAAQWLVAWLTLVVVTALVVSRMRSIHAVLLRGSRVVDRSEPPPEHAIRLAFRAPVLVVWGLTLVAQAVVLTDALGWVPLSGLDQWPRMALPLLAVAISCAGLHPSIMLWRMIIWGWLGRLHPDDVPEFTPGRLAHRLAFTAALPVAMVGLSAVVVLLSHLFAFLAQLRAPAALVSSPWWTEPATPSYALLITLVTSVATWLLVRRVGDRTATDLVRLTEEIQRVQRRGRPSTRAQLAVFELIPRTSAGLALGRALAELAGRFSEIAEKEQQAGRAMESVRPLRTQFLASMSHDLRSPLNAIVGFAALVGSGAEGPLTDEQRESVTIVQRSARDLLRLVNNILDWARLDAGRFEVAPSTVPFEDWLQQTLAQGDDIVGDGPVRLRVDVAKELARVTLHVDERRMAGALLAVLDHAAGVMDEGEVVLEAQINLSPAGDRRELQITVSDRGPGIRPADAERIFQAFREIQDPSGKRVRGLGVGLAVAREVVRAHDGELTLHSRPGEGSTFVLTLPLRPGDAPPPRVKTLPPPPPA